MIVCENRNNTLSQKDEAMTRAFRLSSLITIVAFVVGSYFGIPLHAENPAFWSLSEGTNGEDIFWTSPTTVDVGYPRYRTNYEITRIEAFAGGIGVDVTDQLGETTGTEVIAGLPVSLIDETVTDPTSGTSATIDLSINSSGHGQFAITDVTLGTIAFLFFPIQITRIEIDSNISVEGVLPGDFDLDNDVGGVDFLLWQRGFSPDPLSAGDLSDWQEFFGTQLSTSQIAVLAVPEPATTSLMAAVLLSLGAFLRRKL